MDYVYRCLKKAKAVLDEVIEEDESHPYKQIVGIWEALEQIIRAVIYAYRHVTYEKPQKLINMLPKLVKRARKKETDSRNTEGLLEEKRHRPQD